GRREEEDGGDGRHGDGRRDGWGTGGRRGGAGGAGGGGPGAGRPDRYRTGVEIRADGSQRPGLEALRLAVHRPELVADRLEAALFVDELQRTAFLALAEADDLRSAVDRADPEVAALLRRVIVEEPVPPDDPRVDPVAPVLAQLVRDAARRELADLQAELRATSGDLGAVAAETASVRRWLEDLDDAGRGRTAADRLVAWLSRARQESR
ncbi:MAG: hypothetical protein ACRDWN_06445, partial [Acidimicrobiales bacterium]